MALINPSLLAAASAPVTTPVITSPVLGDDAWLAASSALAPLAPVTVPGMFRPFYAWQAAAYTFATNCIARWGGALLGDDMGLGKTQVLQALMADRIAATGKPGIAVIPPVAEGGWITDLRASFPNLTIAMVKGHTRKALPVADIYLVSDDSRTMQTWLTDVHTASNGKPVHTASAWAASASIICRDEIHRDKGNNGKPTGRAKVMLALGKHCRATSTPIVAATGTLLSNRPVEAFIPLQVIGGEDLVKAVTPGSSTLTGFLWTYCAPKQGIAAGGRKYTTFGGIDQAACLRLHEYMRRSVYVRREKTDLGEGVLPHGGWVIVPLALPDGTMRRYLRIEHEFFSLCTEERGAKWANKVERAKAIVQMGMMREEAGIAKCEAGADYIADLVADGKQVVAFYDHKAVFLKLATTLAGKGISVVGINGQITGDDRIAAIEDFQAGRVKVCLAQIKAAGMAVTLTAASEAVYLQTPWSAGDLGQTAGRILRTDDISKARAAAGERITWHVLQAHYADGDPTFDAHAWSVLETKCQVTDAVNSGRMVTMPEDSVQKEAMMTWQPASRHYKPW